MPKFVTTIASKRTLRLFCLLTLLSGCGDGSDSTKAKATLQTHGQELKTMEEGLAEKTGIGIIYHYKPGHVQNQVDSVKLSEEIRKEFPLRAAHHYALSVRYTGLKKFSDRIESFLKEHEDYLRNTIIKERYDKLNEVLKKELEAEKQEFPDEELPDYNEAQALQFEKLDADLTLRTKTLEETHNVIFKISPTAEEGKFEVSLNPRSEFNGKTEQINSSLARLLADSETYFELLQDTGDIPLTNILEEKIEAIKAVLP